VEDLGLRAFHSAGASPHGPSASPAQNVLVSKLAADRRVQPDPWLDKEKKLLLEDCNPPSKRQHERFQHILQVFIYEVGEHPDIFRSRVEQKRQVLEVLVGSSPSEASQLRAKNAIVVVDEPGSSSRSGENVARPAQTRQGATEASTPSASPARSLSSESSLCSEVDRVALSRHAVESPSAVPADGSCSTRGLALSASAWGLPPRGGGQENKELALLRAQYASLGG